MRHLDQQAATLRQHQEQAAEVEQQARKPLTIEVAGVVLEVRISVSELRTFLGIPNMNLDGLTNFREAEINDPQEDIEDEDHAESDNEL